MTNIAVSTAPHGSWEAQVSDEPVRWPRVKQILEEIMARWERREGRRGMPGIHDYHWESPEHLANDNSMGKKFIEPGVPGEETNLGNEPFEDVSAYC